MPAAGSGLAAGARRPAPVCQQLLLVQHGPLDDLPERSRRQRPGQQGERVDADRHRLPAIARVKVRERMVVVVHRDHDAEEGADPWHANSSCLTAATATPGQREPGRSTCGSAQPARASTRQTPRTSIAAGGGSTGTAKAWQPTGDGLAGSGPVGSRPAAARPVRSGTARASGGLPARCPGRGTVSRISRPFIRIREL